MHVAAKVGIGLGIAGAIAVPIALLAMRDDGPPEAPFSPDGRERDFRNGLDVVHLAATTPDAAASVLVHVHDRRDEGVRVPTKREHDTAIWANAPETFEVVPTYAQSYVDRYGLFSAAEAGDASNHDATVDATELSAFLTSEFGGTIDAAEAAKIVAPSETWDSASADE